LAVIIACVVVVHVILPCFFIRTKRLKAADAKLWIPLVIIFGPIAWLLWWFRHRALSHSQTPLHHFGLHGCCLCDAVVARYFTMEVMRDPVMACDGFT
jgi:hypothetical protein